MINKLKRSRRAFSLVEILFAVIIIGVLTAVAIPSLFSQKGKADDSNAKQSIRTVQQLARTGQDDNGLFPANIATSLTSTEKDIVFTAGPSTSTGNVRTVSIVNITSGGTTNGVSIAVEGSKTDGTNNRCWFILIDGDGVQPTTYGEAEVSKGGCKAGDYTTFAASSSTAVAGVSGLRVGDFPTPPAGS